MSRVLHLLHIEDSQDDTDLITLELEAADYEVCYKRIETTSELRNALTEERWDIIILDYKLPSFDPRGALEILKSSNLDIPYILVSGHIGEEAASEMMRLGVHDYIMKGNLARLAPAIERELREVEVRRERKQAEEALRQSEAKLHTIYDSTSDAINLINDDGYFFDCNNATLAMFGCATKEEFCSKHPADLSPPTQPCGTDSLILAKQQIAIAIKTGRNFFEWEHQRADTGETFPADVLLNRMDLDGKIVLQATVRNITERKHVEEKLRIAATAFESQQGMIITNAQRIILQVNKAFTEITGYSAEEAVGQTPKMLSSGLHDKVFYVTMNQTIGSGEVWQGEIWNRYKNGEIYPQWLSISTVKDASGVVTHYVGSFSDISEHKAAKAQIDALAFYDPLTNLPNRRLLINRLEQTLAANERHTRKSAVMFIDLDNFKTVNDVLGHHQGDIFLTQVATRLSGCISKGDTLARLGSDEFVVLLEDLSENELQAATQAEEIGNKMLASFNQDFVLANNTTCHSTASIGVTLCHDLSRENSYQPLKSAELAMFQAKAAGRNTLCFFDAQMQAEVSARAKLEADLRQAIQLQQLLLYYQPQVQADGCITGVEALIRWQHPQLGMVSPAQFIPIAEASELILQIGLWVLETACTQLANWASDPEFAHLTIAVNVSARQLRQADFVDTVLNTLSHTKAKPEQLKLELTESLLVDNVEDIIAKMNTLKDQGINFSLDDFGTGYSSLSYLKRLPLNQLKIDQSFVRDILTDPNDAAIASMIVALADSMGISVIAEGVESLLQADLLAQLGCLTYQGFFFQKPLPLENFEAFARTCNRCQSI